MMVGSPSSGLSSVSCLYIFVTVDSARTSIFARSSERLISESSVPTRNPGSWHLERVDDSHVATGLFEGGRRLVAADGDGP